MTSPESTETDELSARVLKIIGAYGMGTAPAASDSCLGTAPEDPPREQVLLSDEGSARDRAGAPVGPS